MAELFGFRIERPKKDEGSIPSFTAPTPDDGTIDMAGGGFFGHYLEQDGRERTDLDLIRRYRDIATQPECDTAIEDIINEGIVANEDDIPVQITLDRLPFPEKIKRSIRKEFMSAPQLGELVALDSSLVLTPPKGLEIGFVPIVTRQSYQ